MSTPEFFMSAWNWKPSVVAGCLGLLAAYATAARPRFSARAVAWVAGVALIFLALVSPLDELADRYLFSVHMAKHILFVLVVPALLLIGMPPEPIQWLSRRPAAASVLRWLGQPAVAWMAGIGAMACWHIPAAFNAALAYEPLHIVEHLSLLVCGTIYWWPILSPVAEARLNPVPQAVVYLFTSCLACTAMGVAITFASTALYPAYAQPADAFGMLDTIRNQWGISAALDQQIGGLLMWVPGCLIYLTGVLAMFARWYGQAEEAEMPVEA
jgi:putative membrane protein